MKLQSQLEVLPRVDSCSNDLEGVDHIEHDLIFLDRTWIKAESLFDDDAMQTKRKERSDAQQAYKRARTSIKQLERERAGLVQARSAE